MNLKKCPKCQYVAKTNDDPLITKYNALGECPNCGIIVQKYLDAQKKRKEKKIQKDFVKEEEEKKQTNKQSERSEHAEKNENSTSDLTDITDLYEYIENILSCQKVFGAKYNIVFIIFIAFLGLLISSSFSGVFFGAIIGMIISKLLSKNNENTEFTDPAQIAKLSLLPIIIKLAQIDGAISKNDYKIIHIYISNNFDNDQITVLLNYFNNVIIDSYSLNEYAMLMNEILQKFAISTEKREELFFALFEIYSDNTILSENKKNKLNELPHFFELPDSIFSYCLENIGHQKETKSEKSLDSYYTILECLPDCTLDDLKKAYRKKSKSYHPDVLLSKNLPDELIKFSEERYKLIKDAYEILKIKHER